MATCAPLILTSVRGGNHHNRPGQALRTQISFQEIADLSTTLANKGDYVHVGFCIPCEHAKQYAFSYATACKNSGSLPLATREERVYRAYASSKGFGYALSRERIRWRRGNRHCVFTPQSAFSVYGFTQSIQNSAEQSFTDLHLEWFVGGGNPAAGSNPNYFTEGHHQHLVLLESNHFRVDRFGFIPAFDSAKFTN